MRNVKCNVQTRVLAVVALSASVRFLRAGNWDRGYGAWGVRCGAFNVMDFASGGQKYF